MSSFEDHVKKMSIRDIIITSNMTALSIVIALLWKDAIIETLSVLPKGHGIFYLYMTAGIGTIIVVSFAFILLKTKELKKEHIYSFKKRINITSSISKAAIKISRNMFSGNNIKYNYKPRRKFYFF